MTPELFESLLYSEESDSLDFKEGQYSLTDDKAKAEFIKDIIAFANSWRKSDAYILRGVREVKGGRSEVLGVNESVEDAHLQQMVNSKTNRPIHFSYRAFEFAEKQVGIIHIPIQKRPFFVKKDYEHLKQGVVYIRRGSSTDQALPDEIASMNTETFRSVDFDVQVYDVETKNLLGQYVEIEQRLFQIPPQSDIEDYQSFQQQRVNVGNHNFYTPVISLERDNTNFYRELADFIYHKGSFASIVLAIKNTGNKCAENVRIEAAISKEYVCEVCDESDIPIEKDIPAKTIPAFGIDPKVWKSMRPAHREGYLEIAEDCNSYKIGVEYNQIQGGRTIYLDPIYFAKRESGGIMIRGTVFSQDVPKPFEIGIGCNIEVKPLTMKNLREFGEQV